MSQLIFLLRNQLSSQLLVVAVNDHAAQKFYSFLKSPCCELRLLRHTSNDNLPQPIVLYNIPREQNAGICGSWGPGMASQDWSGSPTGRTSCDSLKARVQYL